MTRIICLSVIGLFFGALMLPSCSKQVTSFRGNSNPRAGANQGQSSGGGAGGTGSLPKNGPPLNLVDKNLMWKRYRSLEQSLMSGLSLSKSQLCKEAGKLDCVDKVHLFALGGNEPFKKAQYDRLAAPSVTTGVAIERLVLSACSERLERDKSGSPVVFTKLTLNSDAPNASAVKEQAKILYQRLLLRDPTAEELQIVASFAKSGANSETVAKSLCFAIASHAEFLFI